MSPAAEMVVLQLGMLQGVLSNCTEEDLAELFTWACNAFERDRDEIAHLIACERMRRRH